MKIEEKIPGIHHQGSLIFPLDFLHISHPPGQTAQQPVPSGRAGEKVAGHVVAMENQNLRLTRQGHRRERKEKTRDQKNGQQPSNLFPCWNPGFQSYHLFFP